MKKIFSFYFVIILLVTMASCGPKPEEQVKDFAVKFGDFVNTNQKDSIQKYYPDFELTDSLATVPVGNITVNPGNTEGVYLAEFSPETFITVKLEKDGKISIVESKGVLAVDSKGLDLVKNANLWNEDLKDTELRNLVNKQLRQDSIERAEKLLKALPTSNMFLDGSGELKDAEKIADKLTALGYERQGKFSRSREGGEIHEGGLISLILNWEGKPYVTIELSLDSFYDEIEEHGGFSEEYNLTFLKEEDAQNFYKGINHNKLSAWVEVKKKNNTITLSSWGD